MDHIHYMIETEPTMSVSKIANGMKSYTTYLYGNAIRIICGRISGKNIHFGQGYFACSVGNVSEEMLKKHIENQG